MHTAGALFCSKVMKCFVFQVDYWLNFAWGQLACSSSFSSALQYLDRVLGPTTYLVGSAVTVADFAVWENLYCK